MGGDAERVSGVDGGEGDGFGKMESAVAGGEKSGGLHAASGGGGGAETGAEGDGGVGVDQSAGCGGGCRREYRADRGVRQQLRLGAVERRVQIDRGCAVSEGEPDPIAIRRRGGMGANGKIVRLEEMERVAGMGEEVDTEKLGEFAANGSGDLGFVEFGGDIEDGNEGCDGGVKSAKNGVRCVAADGSGPVSEGQVEEAPGKVCVIGNGGAGIDKGGHDDGTMDFVDDSVAGFGEVVHATGRADAEDAPVVNENRAVVDDAEIETRRAAAGSLGSAQRKQLAGAAEEQRSMH